jgi:hypothetical protein
MPQTAKAYGALPYRGAHFGERSPSTVGVGLRMLQYILESGIGLPHSTTLARITARHPFREGVECGSPIPLFSEKRFMVPIHVRNRNEAFHQPPWASQTDLLKR